MLASALLALPFPMRSAEGLNLDPAEHWPDPDRAKAPSTPTTAPWW